MRTEVFEVPDRPELFDEEGLAKPQILVVLTCRTDGCDGDGIQIPQWVSAVMAHAYCGVCGNEITDIRHSTTRGGGNDGNFTA